MLKADDPRLPGEARSDPELEVRKDRTNTPHASTRSLATAAAAGSIAAITVAVRAGLWPLAVAAALASLVGVGRIILSLACKAASRADRSIGPIWDTAYQAGAVGYSGVLGAFAMLTLLTTPDPTLHMLAAMTAIGYAAGVAGRNWGRPAIAMIQLALAVLPVALGLLLTADGGYRTLGLVMLLVFAGMMDAARQANDLVLRASRAGRRNQILVDALQAKAEETDAANAANDAKTRFLANMSHEIRTPLNGVLGMTEAMLADPLSDQQRARLMVVRQSGAALLTLLNDILDLSKVEAGKLELESAPFRLGDLLESVAATFGDAAAKRGIGFFVFASEQDLGLYEGDGGRLRQILFNLISNALKFTQAGRIEVKVAFEDERLDVQVSDTGIGIAPEHLERLFQRFSQADASTPRRFGGTGLGLAICQELTSLLNGRISARSRLGEGATFLVSLPITRLAPAPAAVEMHTGSPKTPLSSQDAMSAPVSPPPPPPPPSLGAERRVRLLCAEDNDVNQIVLIALLEPFNYDLTVVDNGLQALEAYRTEAFDLVLLDVQMPVMDGPAAAAAIRHYEAQTHRPNTPIIALTANVMADQIEDYLASGMNQIIPKPINIDELYDAIQHHLGRPTQQDNSKGAEQSSQPTAVVG